MDETAIAYRDVEKDAANDGLRDELSRLEQLQAESQELLYRVASALAPVLRPEATDLVAASRVGPDGPGRQRAELTQFVVEAQHRQHALLGGLRDMLDRVNL